jgi:hypothetical protein
MGMSIGETGEKPLKSYCLCGGVLVFLYRKACYENNGLFGLIMVIIVQSQIDLS